jgi:hypothetical protein
VVNTDEQHLSQVTVRRQLGKVDGAAHLLARELDRLLSALLPRVAAAANADDIVEVIADAVRFAIGHSVLSKVHRNEPTLVTSPPR